MKHMSETRIRTYGADFAFLDWVRKNPNLKSGEPARVAVMDFDVWVHQYRSHTDRIGERRFDNIMVIETKTHRSSPVGLGSCQRDTVGLLNLLFPPFKTVAGVKRVCQRRINLYGEIRMARWWGVHLLEECGDRPENSPYMWWDGIKIDTSILEGLIRFDRSPFTTRIRSDRRHHTSEQLALYPAEVNW